MTLSVTIPDWAAWAILVMLAITSVLSAINIALRIICLRKARRLEALAPQTEET